VIISENEEMGVNVWKNWQVLNSAKYYIPFLAKYILKGDCFDIL
jgi:hypothetical protein